MLRNLIVSFLGLMILSTQGVSSAVDTIPTLDQSLSLRVASAPRISPDGRYVVHQLQETNWEENAYEFELWIAVIDSKVRYQLTNSKKSNMSPAWSPDSRTIAFISDRDGKRQIYMISPTGGESYRLTNVETGVNSFSWSPDGRRIAFTALEAESRELKERRERYGDFEIVLHDRTMTHLWMIDVPSDPKDATAEPFRLTEGDNLSIGGFSWSPDSKQIAISAATRPEVAFRETLDIFVLDVEDKRLRKIVGTPGPDTNPIWSPDGDAIAFQTAAGREFFYYGNSEIAVVSPGGGEPRILTGEFDENPFLLEWSAGGIFFSASQRTYSHLFNLDPASGRHSRVSQPHDAVFAQFSFSSDCSMGAFLRLDSESFPEVYVSSLSRFEPVRLTNLGDQIAGFRLGKRKVIEWKSTDGTAIEGVLVKPADFDPNRRYPLLVVIHGGPTGVDRPVITPDRYYPVERFVARGALVLMPNYRGSAGYGEKFRSLNVRNLGVGDYWDVISGVDFLIERGLVDRERVGVMGWSQGGYISAFIATYSDRFKAVSVGAGISNWVTYYVNTDIPPFTRQYLKATPWDDPEIYRKTSPMSYVNNARTPTLIQHGEFDRRVPIPNAYELHRALNDKGVPVRMIVYKGFGHGVDKPKQQKAVMEHNYEWFGQWIWGDE